MSEMMKKQKKSYMASTSGRKEGYNRQKDMKDMMKEAMAEVMKDNMQQVMLKNMYQTGD